MAGGKRPVKHRITAAAHAREAALKARKLKAARTHSQTASASSQPLPLDSDFLTSDFHVPSSSPPSEVSHPDSDDSPAVFAVQDIDTINLTAVSDTDSDCGYTGGVGNQLPLDWDDDGSDEDDSDWDGDLSDGELSEFGEEEMEEMKKELWKLLSEESVTPYEEVSMPKGKGVWKKAEKNRDWGYNGLSVRTRERREQEARAVAKARKNAKTRCVPSSDMGLIFHH